MPLFSPTRILRLATTDWSKTLHLPKSTFPARAPSAALERYRVRCADELYSWQREHRPATRTVQGKEVDNEFVLHDGPPYANGPVHVGHALNKILKDLILRTELARGRRVQYRPGWDCHGLPIELKALQQARAGDGKAQATGDVSKEAAAALATKWSTTEVRSRAKALASATIETQMKSFREWGVMGDWGSPYKTMDPDFEIRQLGVFREMVRKGLISRHRRPVHWSPSSRTALAEAELEYDDSHKCTAAFVKMPFVRLPAALAGDPSLRLKDLCALIWTTTPWTLPANKAVAVRHEIEYTVVELAGAEKHGLQPHDQLLIAKDRVEHVLSYLPAGTTAKTVLGTISGALLADGKATCYNLFQDAASPLVSADFVTATSGTGLVHVAPGHGMEDYQVCQQAGIGPAFAPVDDDGKFTQDVSHCAPIVNKLGGQNVQTIGVEAVLDILRAPLEYRSAASPTKGSSLLLASHEFIHKNPIDWRTKQPVIIRATAQWFADVSAIRKSSLQALDSVHFIPQSGKTRLTAFVSGRSQWCISRQRAWGVPIPALYHKETGEACITDESIHHIISVLGDRGTDAWFSNPEDDSTWLHASLEPGKWTRGKDTMDVWFDSGTTWTMLPPRDDRSISDVYVEGTDQHRGWFQSSLLTYVAVQDHTQETPRAPYGILITHGFTLDGEGRKMSKSLGNVIAPSQIIDGSLLPPLKIKKQKGNKTNDAVPQYDSLGPDVLRLWVASSDYTHDVSIVAQLLQEVQQTLQKYRVTFKFLLGVLNDYPAYLPDEQSKLEPTFADRAIMVQLGRCNHSVYQACSEYHFHQAVKEINNFVASDLSAFYFEVCKDTMYTGSTPERRRTQRVLVVILLELLKMLGPIVPHLVEEVWEHMPLSLKTRPGHETVDVDLHPLRQQISGRMSMPSHFGRGEQIVQVEQALGDFKRLSEAVKLAQEEARRAGFLKSGLGCKVMIYLHPEVQPTLPIRVVELDQMSGPVRSLDESQDRVSHGSMHENIAVWDRKGELADLLVVSQVEVRKGTSGSEALSTAWRFVQALTTSGSSDTRACEVAVVPPESKKCIRCWKFTADDEDRPCGQCMSVIDGEL